MNKENWIILVWLGLAIFICIGSVRYSLGSLHNPGPGFLSFIAGVILGVLALIVHLQSRGKLSRGEMEKPLLRNKDRTLKMVLTIIALLAYSVGMNYIGFLISTTIFVVFLLWVIEPQRWYTVIFGSVTVSLSAYCIFEWLLEVSLPKGFFQFF